MKPTFTSDPLPVLNTDVLKQINKQLGEARNIAAKLIDTFSSTACQHHSRIQEALEAGDHLAASRSAHALKGGALTIGLARLAHTCSQLEARLSEDGSAAMLTDHERRALSELIRTEYDLAMDALSRWPD